MEEEEFDAAMSMIGRVCFLSFLFFFLSTTEKSKAAKLHFRCNKGWCEEGELDWLSAQGARGNLMSDEARVAI